MVNGDEADQNTLSQGSYVNSALMCRQNNKQQYRQEGMHQRTPLKGRPAKVSEIVGANAGSPRRPFSSQPKLGYLGPESGPIVRIQP